jgi:4-hydroxybenzoate polyprenyltransferase
LPAARSTGCGIDLRVPMTTVLDAPLPSPSAPQATPLQTFFHLTRFHIIAIATLAALTFGWLMTGQRLWSAMVFCAIDWFVVNLVNRVVDLAEDRENGIVGTDLVARHAWLFTYGCHGLLVASLLLGHVVAPGLTPWRVAFAFIGLAYNYKLIPWPGGFTRFKEMYFLKNFSSAVLFLISTIAYPMVLGGAHPTLAWLAVIVAFYLPLEITYEIIYDLRDVKGDAALHVPTFPVVHGVPVSHRLIEGLIALSALALVVGGVTRVLGLKELALIGGPIQQAWYFRTRIRHEATAPRCIFLTYLGAAQIASYHLWILAGLPTELPF